MESLSKEILQISPDIRYVAIYVQDKLLSTQRPDLKDASNSESDKYEELIVNPTLLKLVTQRGNIFAAVLSLLLFGIAPCRVRNAARGQPFISWNSVRR
jgi:hypothetical protein